MEAKDLRIGNYVTTLSGDKILLPTMITEQIGEIRLFQVNMYDFKKSFAEQFPRIEAIKNLSPIPLTEEWLLDFGFDNFMNRNTLYVKPFFNIDKRKNGFSYITTSLFEFEVKHIHQLQNLYYALTGKELETKKPETIK